MQFPNALGEQTIDIKGWSKGPETNLLAYFFFVCFQSIEECLEKNKINGKCMQGDL